MKLNRDQLVLQIKKNKREGVRVNFFLSKKIYEDFRDECKTEDLPMSQIVEEFMKMFTGEKK